MNKEIVTFKYPEVISDYYIYRGEEDNHIALRYDGRTKSQFGLDNKWITTWCPIGVFVFS